jgi:hypothetical protein
VADLSVVQGRLVIWGGGVSYPLEPLLERGLELPHPAAPGGRVEPVRLLERVEAACSMKEQKIKFALRIHRKQ